MGLGVQRISNRLAKSPNLPPDPTARPRQASFFDFAVERTAEGDWAKIFVDFGIKCGYSF